jgi:membrane protein implicated in regulation of membrane protease activity
MNLSLQDLVLYPWAVWLMLALIAAILEVALPYFTFSFVSFAALVSMLVAFRGGFVAQCISFALALVVALFFIRPRLLARLHKSNDMPSRSQVLVGALGQVTESIDVKTGSGRVLVNGQDWAARSDEPIANGKAIEVKSHDGIVLIVKET